MSEPAMHPFMRLTHYDAHGRYAGVTVVPGDVVGRPPWSFPVTCGTIQAQLVYAPDAIGAELSATSADLAETPTLTSSRPAPAAEESPA